MRRNSPAVDMLLHESIEMWKNRVSIGKMFHCEHAVAMEHSLRLKKFFLLDSCPGGFGLSCEIEER